MKRDAAMVQSAIHEKNPQNIVLGARNMARRADRVIQVAGQEAENSEDPKFVNDVRAAVEQVKSSKFHIEFFLNSCCERSFFFFLNLSPYFSLWALFCRNFNFCTYKGL